jgi:anti-sigma regulatory factor (Ser/Thr protein kinase)
VVKAGVQIRTFQVNLGEVSDIDAWVENVAAESGASERAAFMARLCIAELAANVLEHSVPQSDSDHIVITIKHLADGIGIEFLDSRAAFDPTSKPPVESDPSNGGGRGLMLLQAYADELTYTNDGSYNRVKFKIKSG